jgi:UDP-N-acetylmuramoyl-tripeptide--D-alanyl-D-alanine ligase
MQKTIQILLKILAKLIIKKYRPKIIGITGSVGKTSTKEAVYTILRIKYRVRRSIKNYNNELGVPLTIIGATAPGRSPIGWLAVFLQAFALIIKTDKNYPEVLVLELGVDRPNDMDYLLSIVKPAINVLTAVGTVHVKYFSSKTELRKEKFKLIRATPKEGRSIVNYDNKNTRLAISESKARVISYGLEKKSDLQAIEIRYSFENSRVAQTLSGLNFKLVFSGRAVPVFIPNILSEAMIYSVLAGAAVGISMNMNLLEIAQALRDYIPPKGRMNLIMGVKNTYILDDTYNSEPASARAAINMLGRIPVSAEAKKYAVLGDMLELGKYSVEKHKEIGQAVFDKKIDQLIVVGERSRDTKRQALEAGMDETQVFEFSASDEAGRFLQNRIKPGDLLLIKGSQGMRMEKIVKELMLSPQNAKELLVRQEKGWI